MNVYSFLYSFHAMHKCKRVITAAREIRKPGTSSHVGSASIVPHSCRNRCVTRDVGTRADHPGPETTYMARVRVSDFALMVSVDVKPNVSSFRLVSRCGLAVRRCAGNKKDLGSIRFGSPFSSEIVVYGRFLLILSTQLMKH